MANFLEQCKSIGKDMARVIKDDPAGTVLDVVMTLTVGAYLFLNKMSGYYQGRVDAVKEWWDENAQSLDEEKGEQSDEA